MYKIYYHKLVEKEDFKNIPKGDSRKIIKAIKKKLSRTPELYGKPLNLELKGYFRLRIGQYRTIYRIKKDLIIVLILKIGLRKDLQVYLEAARRLKLLN